MSPPIHKDWWLAAALTGAALPSAVGQPAADGRQTGVVTTVTKGQPGTSASRPLYIESTDGQRLETGPNQTIHVLFSDQSAMTIGPNTTAVISNYRFDPKTRDGNIAVELTKGLMRVVGGLLSKSRATAVSTPTSTLGVRGGIVDIEQGDGGTESTFHFGTELSATNRSTGQTQNVNRAGFKITINGPNVQITRQTVRQGTGGAGNLNPGNNQLRNRLAKDRTDSLDKDLGNTRFEKTRVQDILNSGQTSNQS